MTSQDDKPYAVKKTFSLPEADYEAAVKRSLKMGYRSFSEYLQFLIRKDLEERPTHEVTVIREEPKK